MKRPIVIIGAVAIIGFIIVMSLSRSPQLQTLKVGVIGPFSGQYAEIGENIRKSIEFEAQKEKLTDVSFIFEDSAFDAKKAVSAYDKLVHIDKVDLLVNVESISLAGFLPLLQKDGLLTIQLTESNVHQKDMVFQIMPYSYPIFQDLGYASAERYGRISLVYGAADLFVTDADFFKKGVSNAAGGKIAYEAKLSEGSDYRTEVSKLLASGAVATTVMLPSDDGIKFLQALERQDKDHRVRIICDANMELVIDRYVGAVGREALDGCISSNLPDRMSAAFVQEYKNYYGTTPGQFTDYAADAVSIIGRLAHIDKTKWPDVVQHVSFEGASGKVEFDENGTRFPDSELRIFKDGKFVKLDQ